MPCLGELLLQAHHDVFQLLPVGGLGQLKQLGVGETHRLSRTRMRWLPPGSSLSNIMLNNVKRKKNGKQIFGVPQGFEARAARNQGIWQEPEPSLLVQLRLQFFVL